MMKGKKCGADMPPAKQRTMPKFNMGGMAMKKKPAMSYGGMAMKKKKKYCLSVRYWYVRL